jgi:hypothetical protein
MIGIGLPLINGAIITLLARSQEMLPPWHKRCQDPVLDTGDLMEEESGGCR